MTRLLITLIISNLIFSTIGFEVKTNENDQVNNIKEDTPEKDFNSENKDEIREPNEEMNEAEGFSSFRNIDYSCQVNNLKGYCMSSIACSQTNGINLEGNAVISNVCGRIGKICCQPLVTCGNTTNQYVTAFTPGGNDLRRLTSCNLRVDVADDSICQIRIDFLSLRLSLPNQKTANDPIRCNYDSVTITGTNHPIPIICSTVSNQHMYAHINQSIGQKSIYILMQLVDRIITQSPNIVDSPFFDIVITQLQCPTKEKKKKCSQADFDLLAPAGCLQYYTDRTGTIKSLTYDTTRGLSANRQLANLNYAICFKKRPEAQCIKFTVVFFSMSGMIGRCKDKLTCTELVGEILTGPPELVENSELCSVLPSGYVTYCLGENPFTLKVRSNAMSSTTENGFVINFENPPPGLCPEPKIKAAPPPPPPPPTARDS